jgi:hypothetical protein
MWLLDLMESMEPIGAQVFSMEACNADGKWISAGMEVLVNERFLQFNRSPAQGTPGRGFRKSYGF